jgi:benzoyl-CoA reductase/2-hydroxyglutaryl-CoA dehydratase subunit BcrC/BadD/HgdB
MARGKEIRLGYYCNFVPEEILQAGGIQPVRLDVIANTQDKANRYVPNTYCTYMRSGLNQLLENESKNINGFIFTNSCHATELMYDIWLKVFADKYSYMLDVPRKNDIVTIKLFAEAIKEFKNNIKEKFAVDILEKDIETCYKENEETKQIFIKLMNLYMQGSNQLNVTKISYLHLLWNSNKKIILDEMEKAINSLNIDKVKFKGKKILLLGSPVEKKIIDIMENKLSFRIATGVCNYPLYYNDMDGEQIHENIYETLAAKYLSKSFCCARMNGHSVILNYIYDIIKSYKIDAVIYHVAKFCVTHTVQSAIICNELKTQKIPCMVLESDFSGTGLAQIETRLQAFDEIIG